MKLYDVPRGSKMSISISMSPEGPYAMRECTFHHIDGMYSYCTIDGEPDEGRKAFHLSASTPMRKVGDHYEIQEHPTNNTQ